MKKKILVMTMALAMAAGVLTGCTKLAPVEDYQADVLEFAPLKQIDVEDDATVIVKEIEKVTGEMEITTPEGKEVKESLEEYVEYVKGIDLSAFAEMSETELEDMQDEIDSICDELVENMDEFKGNAKKAGVAAEEISKIENIGMLGL